MKSCRRVPMAMTSPNTVAYNTSVAWGVIALYVMVVVQVSSWLMKQLPKKVWRAIQAAKQS